MKDRILIIESSKNVQIAFKEILEKKYDLTFVFNLNAGIDLLKNKKIDLILLDVFLLSFQGAQLMSRLVNNSLELRLPPIIATTYTSSDEICEKAFIAGSKRLLKKPISRSHLTQNIDDLLATYNGSVFNEK